MWYNSANQCEDKKNGNRMQQIEVTPHLNEDEGPFTSCKRRGTSTIWTKETAKKHAQNENKNAKKRSDTPPSRILTDYNTVGA